MKFVALWIVRVTIPDPEMGTTFELTANEASYVHIPDEVVCDSIAGDSVFGVSKTGK